MSQFINITGSRESNDPTYRYKMPRMVARTEGRGNGIRTLIANMKDISDALNRPPDLVTKFFGIELGAQSRWEAELEKSTVNGSHTVQDLQKMLNIFIDRFVLCPKCHLPETALAIKKGFIFHKCSACGAKEPVDMSNKLCVYILKQAELAAAAVRAEESEKKEKKEKKDKGEKKEKKEKKDKKEKKEKGEKSEASAAGGAAGEGKEAAEAEAEAEAEEASSSEDEGTGPMSPAALVAAARASAAASKFAPLKSALEALLTAGKDEAARGVAVKKVIEAAKATSAKAGDIFANLAAATGTGPESDRPLLKPVPLALEALYDGDVISEDAIQAWFKGSEGDAAVKAKAKPFVEWLATADEDEEEED